ncbi:CPBP family intramembrane glutamic endopeptidase [Rhizohabitans arisaemae]|uniref:CPBP family intramembrane glutamic endopeptidase n=1 Tax=Rhizohabitans arisaemae TaxID=2720610 RepID=UPI0024B1B7C2|nr:CPBP family intramembrane glutamic endopeptidase [Rhizohabitans arisaemae]
MVAGVSVFVVAYAWLLLTGNTAFPFSADEGAPDVSLWVAVLPTGAAMVLTLLVAPRRTPPEPLADLARPWLVRETQVLVAMAILFPVVVFALVSVGGGDLYVLFKLLFLLAVPLIAFRLLRKDGPKARTFPTPVTWLAPIPAVAVWFVISEIGPLSPPLTAKLPDPVTLAVLSLVTFLTAGILEEVFYRGWLQTRLERLYGRWPAILAASLLFAVMHSTRLHALGPALGLASIVAFQGVFGLMQAYLWARYRNIWVVIFTHGVVNLVYIDMLLGDI